jgi:hypothetical protein
VPVLDSTRLLAQAALQHALARTAVAAAAAATQR